MSAIWAVLPLKIESVANLREHRMETARRTKIQRAAAAIILRAKIRRLGDWQKLRVTLTRIAPRELDDDNLRPAFKALRDGIADAIGVNDRDPRLTWEYAQERGKVREYAARVEIEQVED